MNSINNDRLRGVILFASIARWLRAICNAKNLKHIVNMGFREEDGAEALNVRCVCLRESFEYVPIVGFKSNPPHSRRSTTTTSMPL